MKFIRLTLSVSLAALLLFSCNKVKLWGIKGQGTNVTETRNASGFDRISLSIDAEVYYVQDSVYSVEISAQPNILEVLTTDVVFGELQIDYSKNVRKHNPITIKIHSPEISGLYIDGSGNILANGAINASDMKLRISGSGNISLVGLNAQELDADISGSGNIKITAGSLISEKINISGSGNVDALDLVCSTSSANISGSGNISMHVMQTLDATISGSGDIRYKGTAAVSANVSGSGNIIHL